jgi:hypothetical protein
MDRAGNREYIATLIARESRRDERSGRQRRFDDEDAAGEAADQAIALREVLPARGRARQVFRNERAFACDALREVAVARRVDAIEAGADDRQRRRVASERALVRCGVDADRQSGDDREARARERVRELARGLAPLRPAVPAADDRERAAREQFAAAEMKQRRRRVAELQQ